MAQSWSCAAKLLVHRSCSADPKAPKGDSGFFWVAILANLDIVQLYSENAIDALYEKNLPHLLREDHYLKTFMLKTYPKHKSMFCPRAVTRPSSPT
ncbi:chitin synthase-domain-containing protein, partial [Mycena galericulata]